MKNVNDPTKTLFFYELPLTPGIRKHNGWRPHDSVYPFVNGLASMHDYRLIYRTPQTPENLITWLKQIHQSKTGHRVLWIAGHGKPGKLLFDPGAQRATKHNSLNISDLWSKIARACSIDGVITESCQSGAGVSSDVLKRTDAWWWLGFEREVGWTDSMYVITKVLEWVGDPNGKNAILALKKGLGYSRGMKQKEGVITFRDIFRKAGVVLWARDKNRWEDLVEQH